MRTERIAFVSMTALALTLVVSPAHASPFFVAPPATEPASPATPASPEPAAEPAPTSEPAKELDLSTKAGEAEAARKKDPTPEHFMAEADAKEALGDLDGAAAALRGYLDATDGKKELAEANESARVRLAQLDERRRGKVPSEPASTHRGKLDAARAARLAPPTKAKKPVVADARKKEQIHKKWYFWVTLLAIAGSAGAITGIAITAAKDERDDALDSRLPSAGPGGTATLLRF
jgi:hypothetical protein